MPACRANSRLPRASSAVAWAMGASSRVSSLATSALLSGRPTAQAARWVTQARIKRCHLRERLEPMALGIVVIVSNPPSARWCKPPSQPSRRKCRYSKLIGNALLSGVGQRASNCAWRCSKSGRGSINSACKHSPKPAMGNRPLPCRRMAWALSACSASPGSAMAAPSRLSPRL
ncbi:hypothetical protein D3C80_917230 [compost metagenome]